MPSFFNLHSRKTTWCASMNTHADNKPWLWRMRQVSAMIWQDSNPSPYVTWVELLTIRLYVIIRRILFPSKFYYRKLMISLEHSRNFWSTLENTIKGGTRHYFEPNRFNASLKPHSHLCILFYINIYIAVIISLSLSLSLVFYTLSSS